MIGSIVGAGLSAIGGIAGGIASSKAAKKQQKVLNEQKQTNQAWYDRNYNSDYTQRSDAQALLKKTREYANERYKRAEASAAVTGATDESLAMEKAAANDVVADTMTNIAANADAYKASIDAQKNQMDNNIAAQQAGIYAQQAQAGANLMSNGLAAGAGALGNLADVNKKKE